MRRLILLTWLTLITTLALAQKTHSGAFFSVGLGPAWGSSNGYNNQNNSLSIVGTGVEVDLELGGSLMPGLILHGTITAKSVVGPTINGVNVSKDYTLSETMYGVGVTHYTAGNYFFSGNFGVGSFSFSDAKTTVSTDKGFSFLLKAGKEWWVSKKLGLGAAFTYGKTTLTNSQGTYTEKWNSNRF